MRLHVIDGTYELFRGHFSKRPGHTAPDGRDVKATLGLVGSLLTLIDGEEQATHLAIAFDNPIESFRNELFDGYKRGDGIEPELRAQFDLAEEAAAAAGVVVWPMDRWEADDALATAAVRFAPEVEQVRLMTPDKDLGQVVQGDRIVQVDVVRKRVIDEDAVRARRGVAPASIPDWLGLVGDDADGIPGLPGFGEKSSASLLAHYGSIEAIPDDPEKWEVKVRGAARLAATLAENREAALLYKKLATLVTDVPLEEDLAALEWKGVDRPRFEALCDTLGSETLRARGQRPR